MILIGHILEQDRLNAIMYLLAVEWIHVDNGIDRNYWVYQPADFFGVRGRIVQVRPGGKLHPHEDLSVGEKRHMYVIETNNLAETWSDGIGYTLAQGGIYQVNPKMTHSSTNLGETNRTHLIIDLA